MMNRDHRAAASRGRSLRRSGSNTFSASGSNASYSRCRTRRRWCVARTTPTNVHTAPQPSPRVCASRSSSRPPARRATTRRARSPSASGKYSRLNWVIGLSGYWVIAVGSAGAGRGRDRGPAPARSRASRTPWRPRPPRADRRPSASRAAMADENVQPVPCVWRLAMRSAGSSIDCRAVARTRRRPGPSRWPPLTSAARAPSVDERACGSAQIARRVAIVQAGQRLGLGHIRRDDGRERQQPRRAAPRPRPRRAAARRSSRPSRCRARRSASRCRSIASATASTIARVGEHADLRRVRAEVGDDRVDLRRDQIRAASAARP